MKDESTRDKAVEKLVAGELRAQLKGRTPNCPDAETLAAYVEWTLAPAERLTWETHFATCSWCQEQVSQLVRLDEAEEPAEVLEVAAATGRGAKLPGLRWAWAAPAILALVIAGLWHTGEFRSRLQPSPETAREVSGPTPLPTPTSTGPSAAKEEPATSATPPVRQELRRTPAPHQERAELAYRSVLPAPKPSAPVSGSTAETLTAEGGQQGAIAPPTERADLAVRAAATGRPVESDLNDKKARSTARSEAHAPSAASAPQPVREGLEGRQSVIAVETENKDSVQAESSTPSRLQAAKSLKREKPALAGLTATAGATSAFVQEATPEKPGGWRVGPRGLIQKADGRGNWVTQTSGVETDLLDIIFPSPSIGWAVGRAGTILRTTDGGKTWSKISSPTTNDLVRVNALDEQVARVATRSGQILATADGGKSWSAPPQK